MRQAIIWASAIFNLTPRNKYQRNFNRNSYIFLQENVFENVVWKMGAILSGLNVLAVLCTLVIYQRDT